MLVTGFLENLCERTGARVYCRTARRFARYTESARRPRRRPAPPAAAGDAATCSRPPRWPRPSPSPRRPQAAPVLEVRHDGTVLRDDPYLPPRAETDLPPARGASPGRRPRARAAAGPTVGEALKQALEAGEITADQRREWRRAYRRALRTRADLTGPAPDPAQLGHRDPRGDRARRPARCQPHAGAVPPARAQHRVLAEPPVPGERPARLVRGQRADLPVLPRLRAPDPAARQLRQGERAVARRARGAPARRCSTSSSRSRRAAAASRPGSTGSAFGGGTPAVDERDGAGHRDPGALAGVGAARGALVPEGRAGARSARSRPARRSACGCADATAATTTCIYSFSRGLRVLNAFAQSLNGLYDYATIAEHARAMSLFEKGEVSLRAELPGYDTGAWTLYSLGGRRGDARVPPARHRLPRRTCARSSARASTATRRSGSRATWASRRGSSCARRGSSRTTSSTSASRVSKRSTVRLTISRNGERRVLGVGVAFRTAPTCSRGRRAGPATTSRRSRRSRSTARTAPTSGTITVRDEVLGPYDGALMAPRTILYTGKGGVGKTSVAAATARRCAAAGHAHDRDLDRPGAQPVRLARDRARRRADAVRHAALGPGGAGPGRDGAPLGGGAGLARRAARRPRRRPDLRRRADRAARDGRALLAASDQGAPRVRATTTRSSSTARRPARRSGSCPSPTSRAGGSRRSSRGSGA